MSRELDEACARALGIEGAPPAFSTDPAATPLLLAEVARRGSGAQFNYVYTLMDICCGDVDEIGASVIWALLTATPEQHARAFLATVDEVGR